MSDLQSTLSRILGSLLAAFFLYGAYGNIIISPENAAAYASWGYPSWFHYVTGVLEFIAAILLFFRSLRAYGAMLASLIMAAASLTTLINGDYGHAVAPVIVLLFALIVLALSCINRRSAF